MDPYGLGVARRWHLARHVRDQVPGRPAYCRVDWILGAGIALVALGLGLGAVRVSARRYRQAASALRGGNALPDGRLPAIIVGLVLLIGVAAVVFIIVEL